MAVRLLVYDKNFNQLGAVRDATDIERSRRLNSDYELSFKVPMSSDDFDIIQLKGHVKDERGQYYVVNDRARDRKSKARMVEFSCMHVMFKLADFKFPYASYIDEAFGVSISTLLTSISSATGGKFTFSVDDSFDLMDVKDFGQGNCLQALNRVIEIYGCEVDPDNFVIHVKKQIGMNQGYQARIKKNLININFKDNSRSLVTRMFAQMKDGLTFIGQSASVLTTEEYDLLNAVPGAIVGGIIQVNYLISPYAAYWSNTTNTYYDGEIIKTDIEDPIELLEATRRALRENEVPAIDVGLNVADLHRIDTTEPEAFLGDTITIIDSEMQINNITARVMGIKEYPNDLGKHPDLEIANFFLRDYNDIIADLDKSKQIVDRIVGGGKVLTSSFESFAKQAIIDINNSKTEVIYDTRGIVLKSTVNPLHLVVHSSEGTYMTKDGGASDIRTAITADGIAAPYIVGILGEFAQVKTDNLIAGSALISSALIQSLKVEKLDASTAKITSAMIDTINANQINVGTLNGFTITAASIIGGTVSGTTITGGTLQTATSGSRVEVTNGQIFVYDTSGLLSIKIDSTTSPPRINHYDSGALKTSTYRSGGNYLIASDDNVVITGFSSVNLGTGSVPTYLNGSVRVNGGTAFNSITQSGTSGATLAQLETQVNTIIQNLRSLNIYAT